MSLLKGDEFISVATVRQVVPFGSMIVDLGSGTCGPLRKLIELGYKVKGVDFQNHPMPDVWSGDLRHTPFESSSADAIIAECTLSICGNVNEGLKEAYRLLKKNGILVLLDICHRDSSDRVPTRGQWIELLMENGFTLLRTEDFTQTYHEALMQRIWDGEDLMCEMAGTRGLKLSEVEYRLFVARKEIKDGSTQSNS
jgi:SAM-dependent methyltransferase